MNEQEMKDLQGKVDGLREIIIMHFSEEKQKEEKGKLIDEIIAKIHPPKREMKWALPGADGKLPEDKIYLGQFLKAVDPHHRLTVKPEIIEAVKKAWVTMTEDDDAQGGFAVPVEYANEIIKLELGESILRRLARNFPMGSLTRKVPRQLTNVTVTWTGEHVAKTSTKPTGEQLTQTAKKLAAVVPMTDELLEDNNVNLDRFIMELIAEAMGREEDRVGFVGQVAGGDPFNGVWYATGVNVATMSGANLVADDLVDAIMGINANYRQGATLITSTHGLRLIMKLKDLQNRPLWQMPTQGSPANIYGYPYEISDQIPSTLGTGTQTAILFGNWKKYFWVSDRGGYEVKSSIAASDITNSESAFMQDETWYRFKKRMSLDVALPAAFIRMAVA